MSISRTIRILGIETSCDETAAAVVAITSSPTHPASRQRGFSFRALSNIVASQVEIHARIGGIVPEVAAREHVEAIVPVLRKALGRRTVDALAVTAGPGLVTSLAVGVETARTLAYAWRKPLIAVNHIEGHVVASLLPSARNSKSQIPNLEFPALALIVSGGHTELLFMRGWGQYECVGATRDDAAGEAFDKVGKLLDLEYPGGPHVAKAAEHGNATAFDFPRPMADSGDFDFSFSGLKTAVRYMLDGQSPRSSSRAKPKAKSRDLTRNKDEAGEISRRTTPRNDARFVKDICASFQQAVVDVLVAKTVRAVAECRVKTVILGGGVAANKALRRQLSDAVRADFPDSSLLIPDSAYTGDNAAMIAAAGGVRLLMGKLTPWQKLDANANWELGR